MSNYFIKLLGPEDHVQNAVCRYVWAVYRVKVIPMNHEMPAGKFQRFKWKYLGGFRGISDTCIPYPSSGHHGLFIELKADTVTVFKKNGDLRKSDHLKSQSDFLKTLQKQGYAAHFASGFDEAKEIIDRYFRK